MSKINDEGFLELSGIHEISEIDELTPGNFPILEGLTPLSLRVLNQASHKMSVAKGVPMMLVGDTPHDLYFISKGSVTVAKKQTDSLKAVAKLRSGDFYGEYGALRGKTRFASIYTAEHSEIIRVDLKAIQQVMDADEAFRVRLDEKMRERVLQSFLFNHLAFNHIDAGTRDLLCKKLSIVVVKRNEEPFKIGDDAKNYYIVLSGEAEIAFQVGKKDMVIDVRRDNDVLGEVRSDNGTKYGYTVRAANNLDLLLLDKTTMQDIHKLDSQAFEKLNALVTTQMKKTVAMVKMSSQN